MNAPIRLPEDREEMEAKWPETFEELGDLVDGVLRVDYTHAGIRLMNLGVKDPFSYIALLKAAFIDRAGARGYEVLEMQSHEHFDSHIRLRKPSERAKASDSAPQ